MQDDAFDVELYLSTLDPIPQFIGDVSLLGANPACLQRAKVHAPTAPPSNFGNCNTDTCLATERTTPCEDAAPHGTEGDTHQPASTNNHGANLHRRFGNDKDAHEAAICDGLAPRSFRKTM